MPQNLPPFANAEDVLQTLLIAATGVRTVKATPAQIVTPLILIRRIGGHSDYVTDFPQLMVTAIGATRPESSDLSLQCQAAIENSFNSVVELTNGVRVLIDGTNTAHSGHPEAYENIDVREVSAMYEMRMRRPRTYYQYSS